MRPLRSGLATRLATTLTLVMVIVALGFGARQTLGVEWVQAHRLVAEGQRALVANHRSEAALAFERARLFAPRAAFVRSALAAADLRDPTSTLTQAVRFATQTEWAELATVCGWSAGLALAAIVLRRRMGHLGWVAAASTGLLIVGLASLVLSRSSPLSVVEADNVGVLVAPYLGAEPTGSFAAGSVVTVNRMSGPFVRVRGNAGLTGWVPLSSIRSVAGDPPSRSETPECTSCSSKTTKKSVAS